MSTQEWEWGGGEVGEGKGGTEGGRVEGKGGREGGRVVGWREGGRAGRRQNDCALASSREQVLLA